MNKTIFISKFFLSASLRNFTIELFILFTKSMMTCHYLSLSAANRFIQDWKFWKIWHVYLQFIDLTWEIMTVVLIGPNRHPRNYYIAGDIFFNIVFLLIFEEYREEIALPTLKNSTFFRLLMWSQFWSYIKFCHLNFLNHWWRIYELTSHNKFLSLKSIKLCD
jgi:hypothetical protein